MKHHPFAYCTALLLLALAPTPSVQATLAAPTLDTANGDYKWVDLHWIDNSTDADGFIIQSSTDGSNFSAPIQLPISFGTNYSAYIGATQKTYFRVASYQGATTGPWSNVLSANTDATKDIRQDLINQFHLTDGTRVFNYNNPRSLTAYTDAQKSSQRSATLSMKTALLNAAASTTNTHSYTIPVGVYRVAPGDFVINSAQNFTINASGATFIIDSTDDGRIFSFNNCLNLTVQGFVWDAENLPYSQGKITAYDSSSGTVTVAIAPGYSTALPTAAANPFLTYDGNGNELVKYNYSSYMALDVTTVQLRTTATGSNHSDLNAGNYALIFGTGPNQIPFYVAACTNVTFQDITNYSGFSFSDNRTDSKGYTKLINWTQIPQPGTNRLFGGNPGQFYKNAGGSILFQGCTFVGGNDDGINLTSRSGMMVNTLVNDTTLVSNRISPQAGDTVQFYDFGNYQYLGTATVASAAPVSGAAAADYINQANNWLASQHDNQSAGSPYNVVFTGSISFLNDHPWAQMFVQRMRADSIEVRNCYWRDMYAQACLMQAAKHVLVADSLFIGNAGSAVSASASQYWQEGQWPSNIVVRNNVIETSGDKLWSYPLSDSSILVCTDIKMQSSARLINNVVIDGNTIVDPSSIGIVLQQAQSASIMRNTIVNPGAVPSSDQLSGIYVNWATNVQLSDNNTLFGISGFTGAGVRLGTDTVGLTQSNNAAYVGVVNLTSVFNMVGIQTDGATFTTGYGSNSALSGQLLGSTIFWNGGIYSLGEPGTSNVVQLTGQTITLPAGQYSKLSFLGTGVRGSQLDQTFVVYYTDGSSTPFVQSFTDWYVSSHGYPGESLVQSMPYFDLNSGQTQTQTVRLFGYVFAINPNKTVAKIMVPNNPNVRIMAMNLDK